MVSHEDLVIKRRMMVSHGDLVIKSRGLVSHGDLVIKRYHHSPLDYKSS